MSHIECKDKSDNHHDQLLASLPPIEDNYSIQWDEAEIKKLKIEEKTTIIIKT